MCIDVEGLNNPTASRITAPLLSQAVCHWSCCCRIQAVASGPAKAASQASGSEKDGASSVGDGQSSMSASSEVGSVFEGLLICWFS